MKTMHHDNCFCLFPDCSAAFFVQAKVPVMGFKTLAAGAIHPKNGFQWTLEKGADFICVGMFDFQVVNDVYIIIDIMNNLKEKKENGLDEKMIIGFPYALMIYCMFAVRTFIK